MLGTYFVHNFSKVIIDLKYLRNLLIQHLKSLIIYVFNWQNLAFAW